MARLRNKRDVPPGGWEYVERETGYRFSADTFGGLVEKVAEHRKYKGLDPEQTERLIESQLCMKLGYGTVCVKEPGDPEPVTDRTTKLTGDMVVAINRAVFKFVGDGMNFVDAEESSRRAQICRSCPFNKPINQCSCSLFYKLLNGVLPPSRKLDGLEVCSACGCSLKAKVLLSADTIRQSTQPDTKFPVWCWQKEILDTEA